MTWTLKGRAVDGRLRAGVCADCCVVRFVAPFVRVVIAHSCGGHASTKVDISRVGEGRYPANKLHGRE